MEWLKKIISDDSGNPSWFRLTGSAILLVLFINWSYINFITKTFVVLDWNTVTLILVILTGKVLQKGLEIKKECECINKDLNCEQKED